MVDLIRAVSGAFTQQNPSHLGHYYNVHTQLWDYYRTHVLDAMRRNAECKMAWTTPDEAAARAAEVREAFVASLGGIPELKPFEPPRECGVLERDGFRIHKLTYESVPGCWVTASLYLPGGASGPVPGILVPCGHSPNGKAWPSYQRVSIELARNGFAVLIFDPVSQGERLADLDENGDSQSGHTTSGHTYRGQQCILNGHNLARYMLADSLRGLDVLAARPEVDAERLGVTGSSGGGTQITHLCATGDPRIKAVAPCTYVTTRHDMFLVGMGQDNEQLQAGMVRDGIDIDDLFLPYAPRPVMLGVVESDFFPIEGAMEIAERLRHVYGLMSASEAVEVATGPGTHNYSKELRQAAVNFFRHHLLDAPRDYATPEDDAIALTPDEELWCTPRGQVELDNPEARWVFELNRDATPVRCPPADPEALRVLVADTLGIAARLGNRGEVYPRALNVHEADGRSWQTVFFQAEHEMHLAGAPSRPEGATSGVITLRPEGTQGPLRAAFEDEGRAVFHLDVRGIGTLTPFPVNRHEPAPGVGAFAATCISTPNWFATMAYLLGEPLLGLRVFDVVRGVDYLAGRGLTDVHLRAEGIEPSLWAYLAGALDLRIRSVTADALLPSFETVAATRLYCRDILPPCLVHGVLRHWDLPDLRTLYEGRELHVIEAAVEQ